MKIVFGGYDSKAWRSKIDWIEDGNAFIFSLRREISKNEKYEVKKPANAYYGGHHIPSSSSLLHI